MDRKRYVNKVFKILPILEGKQKFSKEILPQEIARKNCSKYLTVLICELLGEEDEGLVSIGNTLKGMWKVERELSLEDFRQIVFHCIDILNKEG